MKRYDVGISFPPPSQYLPGMPEYQCRRPPQSFLTAREIKRELTPREFLDCYSNLLHTITTVKQDIQTIMYFRGWRAHGASSGPDCRMRKTFPGKRTVETSDEIAPGIEAMLCYELEVRAASAPPPPAKPRHRKN